MAEPAVVPMTHEAVSPLRLLADQAFSRAAGAPLIPGNEVVLLRDAEQNYPQWLEAIRSAKKTIHFETYILHADKTGRQFSELLQAKAREGVKVRLIYDWFGARGSSTFFFWRALRKAGVEVRSFNPPRFDNPPEWLSRDHRKVIVVDGCTGFVSGLCVGESWIGNAAKGIEPWRDTGVRIRGPAVEVLDRAFLEMWNSFATRRAPVVPSDVCAAPVAGDVALRIVASEPGMAGLYRLDQLIAAIARKSIWLTDAYFLGTPGYVQSLRAAALDGVDVRLLVPHASDIPGIRALSRVGYRPLLQAGVRIFEWNGSMLHAKTSVVDGRWARVGSTNLNLSSWMANYELDVVVEDKPFSVEMERMYLTDLGHATEIVLSKGTKVRPVEHGAPHERSHGAARGSASRAATGVLTIGSTVGAALTRPRLLGRAEAPVMFGMALLLLAIVAVAALSPHVISVTVAVICGWAALALTIKGVRLLAKRER